MMSRLTFPVLLAACMTTAAFAQESAAPADEDVNKQQIVPAIGDIPKPDKGYGTVVGQFVFEGKIPEKELLLKAGDPDVKDGGTCAPADQYRNDLIINAKNRGVRNVFIYMKSAPSIHPDLKKSKKQMLTIDQKACRFYPKALLVRTDQKVNVLSADPVAHNFHTFPLKNQGMNFLVAPEDRVGTPVANPKGELLPIDVKCDLHPWMKAHWLILDHPYMAVSNKDGRFMIGNMPEGTHELRLWHGKGFYLHKKMSASKAGAIEVKNATKKKGKSKFYITVKSGEVTDLKQIKLKAEWFEESK